MKVYVASSWRNTESPYVVAQLREAGHDVFDFRNPRPGDHGFGWREIDPAWATWSPEQHRANLSHPRAIAGFQSDMDGLIGAEAVVLVLPCGRSAHLEAGYAKGAGKRLIILLSSGEPELMYKMADCLALSMGEVLAALREYSQDYGREAALR